jgi:hypothetical protein
MRTWMNRQYYSWGNVWLIMFLVFEDIEDFSPTLSSNGGIANMGKQNAKDVRSNTRILAIC